jgi:ribosomal protein S18 acetylase RimI-like enzyme
MCRPAIILRLFRALGYSQASQAATAQALLMSIAVAPHAAGHGVGQQLVTHFLMAMKQKQVTEVSLTTDRDANERANRFYRHFGFHLARTYITPEGRGMNEYVFDLATWTPVMETN